MAVRIEGIFVDPYVRTHHIHSEFFGENSVARLLGDPDVPHGGRQFYVEATHGSARGDLRHSAHRDSSVRMWNSRHDKTVR